MRSKSLQKSSSFVAGLVAVALLLTACAVEGQLTRKQQKNFYGLWKVTAFRFHDGRVMPGEYMGNPQYKFDKENRRIKTLDEVPAPPPEVIEYRLKGDSIFYPTRPKFPAMKIVKLTADTMVLQNDKLSWYLHK